MNECKCTLIDKNGVAYLGYGEDIDSAVKDALRQIVISKIPTKGPGMWEMKGQKSNKKG